VKDALFPAHPLWSEEFTPWNLSGLVLTAANGLKRTESLARRVSGTSALHWRARATRGDHVWMTSGDAVHMQITSNASIAREYVDSSKTLRERHLKVTDFWVDALCCSASGLVSPMVHSYDDEDADGTRTVVEMHCQYLVMAFAA